MGFLHAHKLSCEKDFHALLRGGDSQTNYPLRFIWYAKKNEQPDFRIAISVPKKKFHNATDRNLLKRRIREGIRHVYKPEEWPNVSLKILVVFCDSNIWEQKKLEEKIMKSLQRIHQNINENQL